MRDGEKVKRRQRDGFLGLNIRFAHYMHPAGFCPSCLSATRGLLILFKCEGVMEEIWDGRGRGEGDRMGKVG